MTYVSDTLILFVLFVLIVYNRLMYRVMISPLYIFLHNYATSPVSIASALLIPGGTALTMEKMRPVKLFSKLNYFIFGYFDLTNYFFDNKNT